MAKYLSSLRLEYDPIGAQMDHLTIPQPALSIWLMHGGWNIYWAS